MMLVVTPLSGLMAHTPPACREPERGHGTAAWGGFKEGGHTPMVGMPRTASPSPGKKNALPGPFSASAATDSSWFGRRGGATAGEADTADRIMTNP